MVKKASISLVGLCIEHTALLSGREVKDGKLTPREPCVSQETELECSDKALQQIIINYPGKYVSASKVNHLSKFRRLGGKSKVVMIFTTLEHKNLGEICHTKNKVSEHTLHRWELRRTKPCNAPTRRNLVAQASHSRWPTECHGLTNRLNESWKIAVGPQDQQLVLHEIFPAVREVGDQDEGKNGKGLHPQSNVLDDSPLFSWLGSQHQMTIEQKLRLWLSLHQVHCQQIAQVDVQA